MAHLTVGPSLWCAGNFVVWACRRELSLPLASLRKNKSVPY